MPNVSSPYLEDILGQTVFPKSKVGLRQFGQIKGLHFFHICWLGRPWDLTATTTTAGTSPLTLRAAHTELGTKVARGVCVCVLQISHSWDARQTAIRAHVKDDILIVIADARNQRLTAWTWSWSLSQGLVSFKMPDHGRTAGHRSRHIHLVCKIVLRLVGGFEDNTDLSTPLCSAMRSETNRHFGSNDGWCSVLITVQIQVILFHYKDRAPIGSYFTYIVHCSGGVVEFKKP